MDEQEENTLLEEHKDPNRTNYSDTCNYMRVRFIPKWEEIYRVFKDEMYLLLIGLPTDGENPDLFAFIRTSKDHTYTM